MSSNPILSIQKLGFQWDTIDPFLFCVHHADAYPRGNDEMGPAASLEGRNLGQDFEIRDGWRMYHGERVPGFPAHPHRGFETVTAVLRGFVDHSDSHGAAGRYGMGDVQWMTAGKGLQHCEMFPLINRNKENPLELFQIWLNLPAAKKFVEPHFRMLWAENILTDEHRDASGKKTSCTLITGRIGSSVAPDPAPDSWAADAQNDVLIAIIAMEEGAKWTLPAAPKHVRRTLYAFEGSAPALDGNELPFYHSAELRPDVDVAIESGNGALRMLLLQGRPIGEPVVQYGPFVMNTRAEIQQAFEDYQRTEFGGWPWDRPDNVHAREKGRFARHADGRLEEPA
jgi:quercetin 2,3-dioxygenase